MSYAGKKVVVALSGGVDSSAAALLALQAGCEVIGVTLDLAPADEEWHAAWGCGAEDKEIIREVVKKLGIEHHFIDGSVAFEEKVLRNCFAEYSCGRTPNPCVLCNPLIKFGLLIDYAKSIGAEALLTGHYAKFSGDGLIVRGDDPKKDQSYFLYRLDRAMLDFINFPVGNMQKSQVRAMAAAANISVANRPDSQDACFVFPGETFAETLYRRFNGKAQPGNFIYQGKTVGKHPGIHRCTIGQRKGLNVALGVPAYVKNIDVFSYVNSSQNLVYRLPIEELSKCNFSKVDLEKFVSEIKALVDAGIYTAGLWN